MSQDRPQLLHLLDRVARHVISPAEIDLLRTAVADLTIAADRTAELEAEVRQLRVVAGRAADEPASVIWSVPCPICRAAGGVRCVAVRGFAAPRVPHLARQRALRASRLVP